jgi:hypothetical protein
MSVFANGTEWDNWSANWCSSCIHDAKGDCPIILQMFMGEEPKQILKGRDYTTTICTKWSDTVDSGPKPVEQVPGQLRMEF